MNKSEKIEKIRKKEACKKFKFQLVNYLENKCNNSKIRNITILNLLRAFHLTIPIFLLILSFYVCKKTVITIIVFLISVALLFYNLNGCFLTLLELNLSNDNYTVIDIFLELFDTELTSKNRSFYTYILMFILIIVLILIYSFRFIFVMC